MILSTALYQLWMLTAPFVAISKENSCPRGHFAACLQRYVSNPICNNIRYGSSSSCDTVALCQLPAITGAAPDGTSRCATGMVVSFAQLGIQIGTSTGCSAAAKWFTWGRLAYMALPYGASARRAYWHFLFG
jgi:hypothetical protein